MEHLARADARLRVSYELLSADLDDYRKLLRRLWQERESVVLVEQDIIPWPGAIQELFACCGKWCGYSYSPYGVQHGFGCTKFSSELMEMLPNMWAEPMHWNKLDAHLFRAARAFGEDPHPHRPPVTHLKMS